MRIAQVQANGSPAMAIDSQQGQNSRTSFFKGEENDAGHKVKLLVLNYYMLFIGCNLY